MLIEEASWCDHESYGTNFVQFRWFPLINLYSHLLKSGLGECTIEWKTKANQSTQNSKTGNSVLKPLCWAGQQVTLAGMGAFREGICWAHERTTRCGLRDLMGDSAEMLRVCPAQKDLVLGGETVQLRDIYQETSIVSHSNDSFQGSPHLPFIKREDPKPVSYETPTRWSL